MAGEARAAGSEPPLQLSGTDLLRLERALQALFNTDKLDSLGMYALEKNLDQFSNQDASRQEVARDLVQTAQDDERLRELLTMAKELAADLKTQRSNALIALSDELLTKPPPPPGALPGTGARRAAFPSWAKGLLGVAVAVGGLLIVARITGAWPFAPSPPVTALPVIETPNSVGATATIVATSAAGPQFGRLAIGAVTIEDTLMLGDYCRELRDTDEVALACAGKTPEDLERMGKVVAITIATTNYACKLCRVEWTMFDASTNERVLFSDYHNEPGWPYEYFTSLLPEDEFVIRNWVPVPDWPGTFFIQFELANDEKQVFPVRRTTAFTVSQSTADSAKPRGRLPPTAQTA